MKLKTPSDISLLLREERGKRQLSIREMATLLHMSHATYHRMELDASKTALDTVLAVLAVLKVRLEATSPA